VKRFSIRQIDRERKSGADIQFEIFDGDRFVAHYWHDFRLDEHGIRFEDGREDSWPVGRVIDFITGGGPQPLELTDAGIGYLAERIAQRPMLDVRFEGCVEIRMGSPFRVCRLALTGAWIPELPIDGWHDVTAASHDGRIIGLVQWDTANNNPGFRVVSIDCAARLVTTSARVSGCCTALMWIGDRFEPRVLHAVR